MINDCLKGLSFTKDEKVYKLSKLERSNTPKKIKIFHFFVTKINEKKITKNVKTAVLEFVKMRDIPIKIRNEKVISFKIEFLLKLIKMDKVKDYIISK